MSLNPRAKLHPDDRLSIGVLPPPQDFVAGKKMPRPTRGGGHRPKSDTMLLRRLINNLKVLSERNAKTR